MTHEESNLPKLSKPAQRALAGAGITKLEHFTEVSEAEVLQLHGMGPRAMELIQQALEGKGLAFANDS